jgi:hypothetical protein
MSLRIIHRERLHSNDPRLKRHVHHDSESRRYAFDTRGITIKSVRHQRHIPIFDQGDLGSCTGNAGVGCMGTGPFYGTVNNPKFAYAEAGAVACYSAATKLDDAHGQYPPTDTGSDGLSVAKALQAAGEISGYQHTFTLDDALKALQVVPLIVGTVWLANMFEPNTQGLISVTGAEQGGHEYVMDEYDDQRGWVGFQNSWGPGFGVGGRFYMQAVSALMEFPQQAVIRSRNSPSRRSPWPRAVARRPRRRAGGRKGKEQHRGGGGARSQRMVQLVSARPVGPSLVVPQGNSVSRCQRKPVSVHRPKTSVTS